MFYKFLWVLAESIDHKTRDGNLIFKAFVSVTCGPSFLLLVIFPFFVWRTFNCISHFSLLVGGHGVEQQTCLIPYKWVKKQINQCRFATFSFMRGVLMSFDYGCILRLIFVRILSDCMCKWGFELRVPPPVS